jgi:hypothetical protein
MNPLPKNQSAIANGGVYRQRVRCGKLNCRCSRGPDYYHPAYYHLTRVSGKLVKRYVPRSEVADLQRAIEAARAAGAAERRARRASLEHFRGLRDRIREHRSHNLTLKENRNK